MSKFTQVRKVLQENLNITIVGAPERNYLPGRVGYWSHTIDFHVAPKTGGVYTAKELQALMMSLVPGLEPTCKDNFYEWAHEMKFGVLYFDEDIGEESIRREITLTDKDMFTSEGFASGKRVIKRTRKVQRRAWVRLFPNAQIAAAALEGENVYRISKSDLAKYRGVITRLASALS